MAIVEIGRRCRLHGELKSDNVLTSGGFPNYAANIEWRWL